MEIEERVVSLPWGEVALKCWNSRTLPPMLVVHGSGANAGSFDQLIPLLSKDYYYVCVDLPGHGRSAHFPKCLPLNLFHFVLALRSIVNDFGWTTYSLMGHSIGAFIQLVFAATQRTKVERLILIEMAIPYPLQDDLFVDKLKSVFDHQQEFESKIVDHARIMSYEEAINEFMASKWGPQGEISAKCILARDLVETNKGVYFNSDPRKLFYIKVFMSEASMLNICSKTSILCPVLLILAKGSILWDIYQQYDFYKSIVDRLTHGHPKSKYVTVEGNHCVHSDNAVAIAPSIKLFLQETRKQENDCSKL